MDFPTADKLMFGEKGDTSLIRSGAASVAIGNGVNGDASGTLVAKAITLNGYNMVTADRKAITADGAVDPSTAKNYVVTKAGVAALTLAAPVATTDDGKRVSIVSSTAYAHTLTATGLLQTGTVKTDVATFAVYAGAGLILEAYQAKWIVVSSVGITFS